MILFIGCGSEPEIVIVDGYSLVLPADFIQDIQPPTQQHPEQSPTYLVTYGKTSYIEHAKVAKLISKYCGKIDNTRQKLTPITPNETNELMKQTLIHYPYIRPILSKLESDAYTQSVAHMLKRLLKILSYREHILKLVPMSLNDDIYELATTCTDNKITEELVTEWCRRVGSKSPILSQLVYECYSKYQRIHDEIALFLQHLADKAVAVYASKMLSISSKNEVTFPAEPDYRYCTLIYDDFSW